MDTKKTFEEVYKEIEEPLKKIFEIAENDLRTHFSIHLSENALKEIERQYIKIVEILKNYQPKNEFEERIKNFALLNKKEREYRYRQAAYVYVWFQELLEKEGIKNL